MNIEEIMLLRAACADALRAEGIDAEPNTHGAALLLCDTVEEFLAALEKRSSPEERRRWRLWRSTIQRRISAIRGHQGARG